LEKEQRRRKGGKADRKTRRQKNDGQKNKRIEMGAAPLLAGF
jgi:hypothetical protein